MLDWLGEIIGGVGESFGSFAATLGRQISSTIWDTMLQWLYTSIYDAIAQFFAEMGNLGAEIYELEWVKAVVYFFRLFGWGLFAVGMVVAIFDVAIEAQTGRVNIKTAARFFIGDSKTKY